MIKLLIVNDFIHEGGTERIMQNIVNYLSKDKYDVTVASIYENNEKLKAFYPSYVKYMSLKKLIVDSKYKRYDIRHFLKAIKRRIDKINYLNKINKEKYDVVIAMKEGDVMALLQNVKAKKKIAWIHFDYRYVHWTEGVFGTKKKELECMKKYTNVVCVSKATYESVINEVGDSENLIIRENPIDVNEIIKLSKENIDICKDEEKKLLVSVGKLYPHKNYMYLLKALVKARSVVGNDYELWIIGDGEQRKELEEYIKEYGLSNVKFLGKKDNPYSYIKNADWFVTTTKGESYGLAVQEALILGVPVLATKCPAFEECVTKDEAILVDNNEDDIYHEIVRILGDKDLDKEYKKHIQERTHNNMYDKRLKEIEELF